MKCSLRKFTDNDLNDLYAALGDKRVVKHMATDGITKETCQQIISESLVHWDEHQIGSFAVINNTDKEIIGWAGFKHWKENEFELLIVLNPDYWGFGGEICDELIQLAKKKYSLKQLYILLPETRKSFRWIQRKGFKFCEDESFNGEAFKKFVKELL